MKTKYVVLDVSGVETPFLFPEHVTHADVARNMGCRALSGGFVMLGPDYDVCVYGESYSLNLSNRGGVDETLIRRALRW